MPGATTGGAHASIARSRPQLSVLGGRPSPQTSLRTSFHPWSAASTHDQQPPARTEFSNSCVRTLKRRSCHSSGSTGRTLGWTAAGQGATNSITTCCSLDNESHGDSGSSTSSTSSTSSNPFKIAAQVIKDTSASVADSVGAQSAADSMDATADEGKKAGGSLLQAGRDLKDQLKGAMPGSSSSSTSSTTGDTLKTSGGQAHFLEKVAAKAEKLASSLSSSSDEDEIAVDSDTEVKTPILENMKEAKRQMKKMAKRVRSAAGPPSGSADNEDVEEEAAEQAPPVTRLQQAGKFLLDQFLPLGLLAAMAVGCLYPSLGAKYAYEGVQGALLYSGFLLVGLAPTSQALMSAEALISWAKLALAYMDAWRCRYIWPRSGLAAAALDLQTHTTVGIFFIQGLNLRRGEAAKALLSYKAVLYGIVSILLITPLFSLAVLRLPFLTAEFAFGLAVFCCMPTTLSSGVSLTQAVGGNAALALLLTVVSNLAGIFTMPFVLCWLLGAGRASLTLSPGPLLANLMRAILAPLLLGATVRGIVPGVAAFVDGHKRGMSLVSACLLITVPWIQISKVTSSGVSVTASSLAAVVLVGAVLHGCFVVLNSWACRAFKLGGGDNPDSYVHEGMGKGSKEDRHQQGLAVERAVILVTSQKTLPVAVTVLNQLGAAVPGGVGLAVIPCVVSHLTQILLDSLLVSFWKRRDEELADRLAGMLSRDTHVLMVEHNHS